MNSTATPALRAPALALWLPSPPPAGRVVGALRVSRPGPSIENQMSRLRHHALRAAGTIALLICSCSTPASKGELKSKAMQLQRTQFIEAAIFNGGTMNFTTVIVSDPAVLVRVRSWIKEHAWPPIDLNTTGAVGPRGYFTIFEGASQTSSAFRIYVYGGNFS